MFITSRARISRRLAQQLRRAALCNLGLHESTPSTITGGSRAPIGMQPARVQRKPGPRPAGSRICPPRNRVEPG